MWAKRMLVRLLIGKSNEPTCATNAQSTTYGAAGTLTLATSASVTGVAYLNKRSDYEALAKSEGLTSDVEARREKAQRYGYANLGLWIGTAIGAGVTTYLYVTRPTQKSAIRVTPWLGPQVAGLGVGGGF